MLCPRPRAPLLRPLRTLAGLLPLALLAQAPLPGVGVRDHRVLVAADAAPWDALARLQVPGVARCTAVLVAPRRALTAAHCLWSARLARYVPADMVHVLARYQRGAFAGHARAIRVRIDRAHDVAAVTLDAPIGRAVLGFAPAPAVGTAAMLGGYNQDRIEVIEADTACRVVAHDGPLIRHDCAATHGTSGAPLLVRGADGGWAIAGLQVAAFVRAAGGIAVGGPVLQALLTADTQGDAQ